MEPASSTGTESGYLGDVPLRENICFAALS